MAFDVNQKLYSNEVLSKALSSNLSLLYLDPMCTFSLVISAEA